MGKRPNNMNSLIQKKNDFYIDHIALGVNDTLAGIDYVEQLTGVKAFLPEGDHDDFYLSAVVNLNNGCFLEIIGPNPKHTGFNPFKQTLKELTKPTLMFWYLGTHHFDKAQEIINHNGFKLERYNHVQKTKAGHPIDYQIAIIGKGFYSEQPNLIQWNQMPDKVYNNGQTCHITDFKISFKNATALRDLFEKLGIPQSSTQHIQNSNQNTMSLTLNTPKGSVTFTGGGVEFQGIGALFKALKLFTNHLLKRK